MIFKTIYYNSSHNLLINNSELIANATTQTVKYFDIPATAEEILITPAVIPDRPAPTPTGTTNSIQSTPGTNIEKENINKFMPPPVKTGKKVVSEFQSGEGSYIEFE